MVDSFETVVIGSGFGGTILALSFANKFEDDNAKNNTSKKVCVFERGQWWLSHEMNFVPKASRNASPNMREFLEDNGKPYHFWAHPDSISGLLELVSADRTISKAGLYDYKVLGNIHSIQASGVGGGSLIYSNVRSFGATVHPIKSKYILTCM
jgi:choline dehydrogenase-like flavoprotein